MSHRRHARTRLALLACALAALACGTPGPYSDPAGVQLPLYGDRQCSDPVFRQTSMHCCAEHDTCFALGPQVTPWGKTIRSRSAFHACNHEFAACMYRAGVPGWIVRARFKAVESDRGWESFGRAVAEREIDTETPGVVPPPP